MYISGMHCDRQDWGRSRTGRECQEFRFGCVKFDMLLRHLNQDFQYGVAYRSPWLRAGAVRIRLGNSLIHRKSVCLSIEDKGGF